MNETIGQEQTDFPESANFLVATDNTAPKTNPQAVPMMVKTENGGNVALHDSQLLSLEMGWVVLVFFFSCILKISLAYPFQKKKNLIFLVFSSFCRLNVPTQPQISHIGRQSDVGFQTVVISTFTIYTKILVLQASASTIGVIGLRFRSEPLVISKNI